MTEQTNLPRYFWMICCALFVSIPTYASTLIENPIPPSQTGNEFLDLDADGTLDHLQIRLLHPVTQAYLEQILDSIDFTWVNSSLQIIHFSSSGKNWTVNEKDPRIIGLLIPSVDSLAPFVTSIDSRYGSYGTGTMFAATQSFPVPMVDRMAPVIQEALLKVSDTEFGTDVLQVRLSEPIVDDSAALDQIFMDLRLRGGDTYDSLKSTHTQWKTPTLLELSFGRGIPESNRPSSRDSIRFRSTTLMDLSGNAVSTASQIVQGDFRFQLKTQPRAFLKLNGNLSATAPPFETEVREFGKEMSSEDMGFAVDIGSADLTHLVQRVLRDQASKTDTAILAQTITVDPSKLLVSLDLAIYGTSGDYVAKTSAKIFCSDSRFQGNCLINPHQILLHWNNRSDQGRLVGSGAYLAKIGLRVTYLQQSLITVVERQKLETWGVMRLYP